MPPENITALNLTVTVSSVQILVKQNRYVEGSPVGAYCGNMESPPYSGQPSWIGKYISDTVGILSPFSARVEEDKDGTV